MNKCEGVLVDQVLRDLRAVLSPILSRVNTHNITTMTTTTTTMKTQSPIIPKESMFLSRAPPMSNNRDGNDNRNDNDSKGSSS
jgi:hypothetical protein